MQLTNGRNIMEKFKVEVDFDRAGKSFHIDPQIYRSKDYAVEGDYSSASYLIAAAASINSDLTIQNLTNDSKQGDKLILDIVEDMGSDVKIKNNEVKICGHGILNGIDVKTADFKYFRGMRTFLKIKRKFLKIKLQ